MPNRLVVTGCAIATVDAPGTEHSVGHLVVVGNRIESVASGPAPVELTTDPSTTVVDGSGCLATPGLVNTHHHLYQWLTRGLAQQSNLFNWLRELYPVWSLINQDELFAGVRAALASLALSGCSTTTDHHYIFPHGADDPLAATVAAATEIGLRFHPCRGSMDLGQSAGGLPPDALVESLDTVLAETERAITRYHDPAPGAMLRIAVAPCSPFSVSAQLLRESAALARRHQVRLHTHLAETVEEDAYCRERHDCSPVAYLDRLGWLGEDVWLAHAVTPGPADIHRLGETGTGVAHCPSSNARLGAGIAPVTDLLAAGTPVGLAVDGSASNEHGDLWRELPQATYLARLRGGADAFTARDALRLATIGGARCLGRDDEIGSLVAGKLADIALWRIDRLGHAGIADPVAGLVFGPRPPLELLLVNGAAVVSGGELRTGCVDTVARAAGQAAHALADRYTGGTHPNS